MNEPEWLRPMNALDERAARLALRLWGADLQDAQRITGGERSVYRFSSGGRGFYLAMTPATTRTRAAVEAETELVRYLSDRGLAVAAPVPSRRDAYVEVVEVGSTAVYATTYHEARGELFRYDPAADNRAHFRLRGRMLGRLHALSREYALTNPASVQRLPRWDDDRRLRDASRSVPSSDAVFWSELRELDAWLNALPNDVTNFGPVHGDFGVTNYRVVGDEMTLFDFGDACRHWYAYDVAVSLYPYGDRPERRTLLAATLEGYAAESPFESQWSKSITQFCRFRVVYMYLVYAERWGLSSTVPAQVEWFARKRHRMRHPVDWTIASGDG
jgi:Ser/Thr protein kinase RdoA (MazF antagonist)